MNYVVAAESGTLALKNFYQNRNILFLECTAPEEAPLGDDFAFHEATETTEHVRY